MKKVYIFCFILAIFISCSNKKQKLDSISEPYAQDNNKLYKNTEVSTTEEKKQINFAEEKLRYFGTVFNTFINDDNVNVRLFPSLNAEILFKLNKDAKIMIIGVSKEFDNIDDFFGNWLKIKIKDSWEVGWVFSKYVENGHFTASELKIIELLLPKEEGRAQPLIGMYEINGNRKNITLYSYKEENQNFYTFAYDWNEESFHYSNIPGSYAWFPETNELRHITYIGTTAESAWSKFTDDFKYVLQDFGTSTGPRGLGVRRVDDGKGIFSGTYYKDLKLNGHSINIVYVYDWWNIQNNELDNEIINFAEEFKKNNPEPEDMVNHVKAAGISLTLIINCELNLDTGVRKIINGTYIYTQ
jgi:hypothetical protein